jgi:hypothetical protein
VLVVAQIDQHVEVLDVDEVRSVLEGAIGMTRVDVEQHSAFGVEGQPP